MKLVIPDEVHQKVMHWVNKATFEVSGFGIIELKDDLAIVRDAILLEQTGSSAETEMKAEDINRAEFELRKSKYEMRWWWHSHVNMSVFWSGTDRATITQLGTQGWFFHTVFNKKDEYRSAFSCPMMIDSPFHKSETSKGVHFADEIETIFLTHVDESKQKSWDKMYEDKVTERSFVYRGPHIRDYDDQMDLMTNEVTKKLPEAPKNLDFETKLDLEVEIEELIMAGLPDDEIIDMYRDDIKYWHADVARLRQEYFLEQYHGRA